MEAPRASAVVAVAVVAAVGLLDAVIGEVWDLAVLFGVVLALAGWSLARLSSGRRPMTLRRDLAARLIHRSRVTGEPIEQMADRAVAIHLDAMSADDGHGAAGG
jgi:hypothetical protein